MADRKETPDVLGDILGGATPPPTQPNNPPQPTAAPPSAAPKPKPARKSRRNSPKQSKWEYMEIVFRDYRGWRPRYVNGTELSDWRNEAVIHQYLNHLGGNGWEMVDIEKRRWYEKVAYFKRQIR